MKSLAIQSPAKLNLHLKVLGRDAEGYHELVTVFHRISLRDTLVLEKQKAGFRLRCSRRSLPVGENNLITRAYRLLEKKFPGLPGVRVRLQKRIPVGAGLGGGSSNAAAFLLGMNRLYRLRLSVKEMASMGRKLGADVPFFVYNMKQAIGLGRGDILKPVATKKRHWFILKTSPLELATKEVYQNMTGRYRPVSLTNATRVARMLCAFLEHKRYERAASLMENDLEAAAFHLRPSLRSVIKTFARLGIRTARMTGSGPTVFAILPHSRAAGHFVKKLRGVLPPEQVVVCRSF